MIALEVNDAVLVQQRQILEQALSSNPKTQQVLIKLIRQVIKEARNEVMQNTHFSNGDPRGAVHSIRRVVYKNILGGNINIYNMKRKAGAPTTYEPPRKLRPGQRGGNRRPRSERTKKMMSYGSHDLAMVLRWLNNGTAQRTTIYGNRGSIAPRNWFPPRAQQALTKAADSLSKLIDTELEKILNKTS